MALALPILPANRLPRFYWGVINSAWFDSTSFFTINLPNSRHSHDPGPFSQRISSGRDPVDIMSWELPVLTTLILSVLGFWWIYSPHSSYQKAIYVLLCAFTLLVDPRRLLQHMSSSGYETVLQYRLDVLLIHHFKMVLTLGAIVW